MRRGFCPECGSPISMTRVESAAIAFLQAARLDDPSIFSPSCEVWVSNAWSCLRPASALKKFEGNPSAAVTGERIRAYFAARAKPEQ